MRKNSHKTANRRLSVAFTLSQLMTLFVKIHASFQTISSCLKKLFPFS